MWRRWPYFLRCRSETVPNQGCTTTSMALGSSNARPAIHGVTASTSVRKNSSSSPGTVTHTPMPTEPVA